MTTPTSQTTLDLGLGFKAVGLALNVTNLKIPHGTVVHGLCRPAGLTGPKFFILPGGLG